MFQPAGNFFRLLIAFCVLATGSALSISVRAQRSDRSEREVPILREIRGKPFSCYFKDEMVSEERLKEIEKDRRYEQCPQVRGLFKVDFARHSLITYAVAGDCRVWAKAQVFRNDEAKKYAVRVKHFTGGCRSAGRFQEWLLIEKIPPGYTVDFAHTSVEYKYGNYGADEDADAAASKSQTAEARAPETLETVRIDMKGCVSNYSEHRFVIKDRETFLKTIRDDSSRDWCLKNLEKIDFGKNSLLGIVFRSGYCRTPLLTAETIKDQAKKRYLFTISYFLRSGLCRHIPKHVVWARVPKLADDYEVVFEVKAKPLPNPDFSP